MIIVDSHIVPDIRMSHFIRRGGRRKNGVIFILCSIQVTEYEKNKVHYSKKGYYLEYCAVIILMA